MAANRPTLESVTLIAGVGRSGTTWLGDVLDHDGRHASYFEPLHPRRAPEFGVFHRFQFVPPKRRDLTLLLPWMDLIVNGSSNPWINQTNHNPRSPHVLIKVIRANLLLPWLQRQLPWLKTVLILRHPLAVLHSRRKLGWGGNLQEMVKQPGVPERLPDEFLETVDQPEPVVQQVGQWVVQTAVPLPELVPDRTHVVFYEDLVRRGEVELARLEDFLGRELGEGARQALGVPSSVTRKDSAVATGGDRLRSWMTHVPPPERSLAGEVLSTAGLDTIYTPDDPLPLTGPDELFETVQSSA